MRTVQNDKGVYLQHYMQDIGPEAFNNKILDCFQFPDLAVIEDESDNRILVLSPHQDDDILGCGGTLKLLRDAGADILVVYMTDGCLGSNRISPTELPAIRQAEAIRALAKLNIAKYAFYNSSDLGLRCDSASVGYVRDLIRSFRPKIIMTPHGGEHHPDHYNTCMITARALEDITDPIEIYAYEVWSSHNPNTVVDITQVIEDKMSALREHQSQIEMIDYAEKIRGLNVYRSINDVPSSKYSEAFRRFSREDFMKYAAANDIGSMYFDMNAMIR